MSDSSDPRLPVVRGLAESQSRSLRRVERSLARIEASTLARIARVRATGLVSSEKVKEVDHLTRTAMTGHALLTKWKETISGGDPVLADELRGLADLARVGKAEIIVNTVDAFIRDFDC